jgi:hypothetical protein
MVRSLQLKNALSDFKILIVCVVSMYYSPRTARALSTNRSTFHFYYYLRCLSTCRIYINFTKHDQNTYFTRVKGLQLVHSTHEHSVGVQAAFHIGQAFRFHQILLLRCSRRALNATVISLSRVQAVTAPCMQPAEVVHFLTLVARLPNCTMQPLNVSQPYQPAQRCQPRLRPRAYPCLRQSRRTLERPWKT